LVAADGVTHHRSPAPGHRTLGAEPTDAVSAAALVLQRIVTAAADPTTVYAIVQEVPAHAVRCAANRMNSETKPANKFSLFRVRNAHASLH